ncbi:hypothetical protein PTKIN_Ptkin10aG0155700 [Pterospermum kingtungense]
MAFGYAYPAYNCLKAVENDKPDQVQQLQFWCQYWILVAILTVCDGIGDAVVSWLPLYNEAKLAFVVYLWYPKWKGTTHVYNSLLRPYVIKHETEIDRNLLCLKNKTRELGVLYWHRALSNGQSRLSEILHYYFSSQEASEPYLDQQTSQASPAKLPDQLIEQPPPDSSTEPAGFHHASQRMNSGQSCVSETEAIQPITSTSNSSSLQEQTSNYKLLVEKEEVFNSFVDHKFKELDKDSDVQLCVKDLQPTVADIGAALGLPAQGSSPHIYSEVLNEFTHGKQVKVRKTEFKEVLSDILLGMAAGLERDPIVILRIDGEDLKEFINGPSYEADMVSLYSQIVSDDASFRDCIIKALEKLTVDQGMPPSSDSWVMSNIVEPALQSWDRLGNDNQDEPVSQEAFLEEFKTVAERVAQNLQEQPVIVAHSENTFDGSGIERLLSNKFELDKSLNAALETVPKDRNGKISKDHLRLVLNVVAPSTGLPPIGAVEQMDKVVADVFNMINADDGKMVKEDEFKKLLAEILGSIMQQLEANPISVSSNSVVHEPLASS